MASAKKRNREAAQQGSTPLGGLIPVQLSQTSPFDPVKIQTSVLEAQVLEIPPVTALSYPVSMIEFIARLQDYYVDLSSVYLRLKFKILKSDDKDLDKSDTTTGVVNNLPGSMINRVEAFLNEKSVQLSCENYAIKNFIETVLNYDRQSAETKLQTNIFSLDTAGKMGLAADENQGWSNRRRMFLSTISGGAEATVLHRVGLDISSTNHYFINGLTFRLRLLLSDFAFYMMNGGASPEATKLKITEAVLLLKTKIISPDVVLQNEAYLAHHNARYQIRKSDLRTYVTPSSGRKISLPNIHLGSLPNLIIACVLDGSAVSGDYGKNPFIFFHKSITSVSLYVNSTCMVLGPVDPTSYGAFVPFYHQMLETLGLHGNYNCMISYDQFVQGLFFACFDTSADRNCMARSHISMAVSGSMRLEIDLAADLTKNMLVAVYSNSPSVLEISKDRVVTLE